MHLRKLNPAAGPFVLSSFGLEAQAARWIVPGSAHASGSGGTNWRTDLTLVNPGSGAANATIWFLPAGADNGTLPTPTTRTVPAGGQLVIPDILDTLFGRSGGGALVVESTETALTVASRTYNKLPDREYGMALPGVPTTQAIGPGETGHLVFLVKSSRYRTNVGFAGTSAQGGTVRVKLRDASGALIGEGTKELLPNGQTQIDRIFDALGAPEGTSGQELPGVPVSTFAVPGDLLRFAGLTGDGFRTNLLLVNLGDSTLDLSATFKGASGNVLSSRAYSVPPRAMVQENGVFPSGQSGFLDFVPGTPAAAVSATSAVAGTPSFYVLATVIHNVSNDPFQVTPSVQAAAPSGSCVRPTLVAAGTVYAFRATGPSGQLTSTTTFNAVSDTVSTSTTDSTAGGVTTRSTTTKTISCLSGNLVGVVSVDTWAQTQIGTIRTVVAFSPVFVGGPGPEVCPAATWTSPAAHIATTEIWIDLGSALAVRQIDVTSSGTQTIEATTLR